MRHFDRFFATLGLIGILCCTSSVHAVEFTLLGTTSSSSSTNANTLVTIDPNTGNQTFAGPVGLAQHSRAIDWNPTTSTLFGSDIFTNPGIIQEINPATGEATPVASIRQDGQLVEIGALAFAPDGTLWGVAGRKPLEGLTLGIIDLITQSFLPQFPITTRLSVPGIDISPDGILYAVYANLFPGEFKQTLVSINLETLSIIEEKNLGDLNVDDIDYAPDGYIYHTNYSFALIRIDPYTGIQSTVGFGSISALKGVASTPIGGGVTCDIQLNKTSFVYGNQVIAQVAQLANPGPNSVPVEVKFWFEVPGSPPVPFLTVGADGSFVLSPEFNRDFGPLTLATMQASLPRGQYHFNCRLLHAVTGALLAEDFNPFQLQ